ncbi:MAG: hypothetical protein LBK25_07370 [Treponema sp.]|jgi:hypothetical protein|nr:hypothetical protein [Treponema sp.]
MDYIPRRDSVFVGWAKILLGYVQTRLVAFNIPDTIFQVLFALFTAFENAYNRTLDANKGPVDIAEKNRTRAAFEKALRSFIKAFLLYSPFVSDKDRDEMRIPIHDSTATPIPTPTTYPEYTIDTATPGQLSVHFWDEASKRRGKPKGVHGAEIHWEMRENEPANEEDLNNSDFATRTPRLFSFTKDKQGKRVYFCLRWENGKGEKGPWGALVHAVVP